jgi:hypothetical protein
MRVTRTMLQKAIYENNTDEALRLLAQVKVALC